MNEQHEILEDTKTSLETTKKFREKTFRALREHSATLETQSILARQLISDTDDTYVQVTASEDTICAHVENLKKTTNKVKRCLEERQHLLDIKKKKMDTKRHLSKKWVEIEYQYQNAMDELESTLTQQNEEKVGGDTKTSPYFDGRSG